MCRKITIDVLVLMLLGACTTPGPGPGPDFASVPAMAASTPALTGPEIQQAMVGKTFASKSRRGIPYTMHLNEGGTGVFVYSGSTQDALTWDISGNVLCFHSKMSGTECDMVHVSGGGYDFIDHTTGALNNAYRAQ